jgi:hypothetical protein
MVVHSSQASGGGSIVAWRLVRKVHKLVGRWVQDRGRESDILKTLWSRVMVLDMVIFESVQFDSVIEAATLEKRDQRTCRAFLPLQQPG